MNNLGFFSDLNNTLGPVQTDAYTGFILSLPLTEASLSLFANQINLNSNEAMVHTIRKFEQLELNHNRAPLSRDVLHDERITGINGSIVSVRTEDYGTSLIIDNKYAVNTKENVMSTCISLLSDWGQRLEESLLYNKIAGAGISYTFSENGGKANVTDVLRVSNILESNRVRRAVRKMITATNQVGTHSIGERFIGHVSIQGKRNFQENITDPNDVTRGYEEPGATSYLYRGLFTIRRADMSIFSSSEISDTKEKREMIAHGDEAFIMVTKNPFNSAIITDPSYNAPFGLHSKVSFRFSFGAAVCRNERIVNCSFKD